MRDTKLETSGNLQIWDGASCDAVACILGTGLGVHFYSISIMIQGLSRNNVGNNSNFCIIGLGLRIWVLCFARPSTFPLHGFIWRNDAEANTIHPNIKMKRKNDKEPVLEPLQL